MTTYLESETMELKAEVSSDICKEIVAFANTHGGTLYIGVSDDGTPIGIANADAVLLQVSNMARDAIKPDVTMFLHYEIITDEGKQIVAITVQKGTDRPYYLAAKGLKPGGVYVRNGTFADPSTDTAIRKMIKETDGSSFETMRSLEQNLSFETAQAEFHKCSVDFNAVKMKTLGMISADGVYSNVGLLLSDQCASTIKAATFAGTDRSEFQDRREFSGSLFRQMEELFAYLELRNQTKATFNGLYRIDTRDYPEEAIRETLMNTLVHREYAYSASSLVSVYNDRMEFVSIGGLPAGIEVEDIMLGLSVCRNPKLAAVFYRLKLIEVYGTGMPKIMKAYQSTGFKPKIEVTANAFKVTLPNCNAPLMRQKAEQGTEERILAYLVKHPSIVRREIDELLNVSQATSNRILQEMIRKDLIEQESSGRTTRYRAK